jgi:hypothetical protein
MKVLMKPLDDLGYLGYGITVNGVVYSRWDTHGQISAQWSDCTPRWKHGAFYVRLQVNGKPRDVRVVKLMLEAVCGPVSRTFVGVRIDYGPAGPADCSLVNLRYRVGKHIIFSGAQYANSMPPGFQEVEA